MTADVTIGMREGGTHAEQRWGDSSEEWGQTRQWGNRWWPARERSGGGAFRRGGALIIYMVEGLICAWDWGGGGSLDETRVNRYPLLKGIQGWTVRSRTGGTAIDRIRVLSMESMTTGMTANAVIVRREDSRTGRGSSARRSGRGYVCLLSSVATIRSCYRWQHSRLGVSPFVSLAAILPPTPCVGVFTRLSYPRVK